ncbi:helix-turn-helix domain-containing protein [Faecalicatena contorta]|uniref:Helix-turn-helix domain-containing protein n=1 Tax=Faecalicatena contorta TaxID=39482 RepID=A0A315ZYZ1_9FIRM|nr:helix-turn-helix domain-containing protein [Faecalicatena contorta]PWJ50479.1 helix-turn-helix protein [Faecalicatena contorta]SUQ13887.1 Helix-turn-helix domain-containing protein [Faecalicatena contorta]
MEYKKILTLPGDTIIAATRGDITAVNAVIQYYRKYIAVLATRKLYDDYGGTYLYVDEELCSRLENKLISKVLEFKILTS